MTLILNVRRGREKLIPAQSHTFAEIHHEIISTVILLPFAILLSVTRESMCMKYWLPAKSVVR